MNLSSYDHRTSQQMSSNRQYHMPSQRPKYVVNQQSAQAPMYQDDGYGDMSWDEQPLPHGFPSGGNVTSGGNTSAAQPEKPTGLRHFSTKVCEKVKEKGLTNYNEVADELVQDYFQNNFIKQIDVVKQEYDMKNIRRRVYDALNVLLAMNIITKNKKDIRWIGLPASASQEITRLEEEKTRREQSIQAKKDTLQEMIMQIVSYKNLIARNRTDEHKNGRPETDTLLHLPFLIINTDKDTNVECSVSSDKSEFLFSFDKQFEIHDDFEILKKMNLACGLDTGTSTEEDILKAKSCLPGLHRHYVDDIVANQRRAKEEAEKHKEAMEILAAQQQLDQQLRQQQQEQEQSMEYYDEEEQHHQQQIQAAAGGRYNRQLQEHLMDGNEDRSAADGIMDDVEMERSSIVPGSQIQRSMYSYSPQKMMRPGVPLNVPPATKRYYVQKAPPQGQMMSSMRHVARPSYQQGRMVGGGGAVGGVKYYHQPMSNTSTISSVGVPGSRYIQRVRPAPPQGNMQNQRVVYTGNTSGLHHSQRVVTQRVVAPGGPHPPGTIIRKVIKRIVVNNPGAPKQSPAQQVIQRKMMEQDMRPQDHPMTSAQAAALIQHPPQEEFDYFE